MKINYQCLPCLVNQVVRVAEMTNAKNREDLFRKSFEYLSHIDFSKTSPEIFRDSFRLLKEHVEDEDPYKETRSYYNGVFLNMFDAFEKNTDQSPNPFEAAVKYAIIGNIIDFGPMHDIKMDEVLKLFKDSDNLTLTVNHTKKLKDDIASARSLLYLGDNCGEICFDKLLVKKIKELNPDIHIYFGVRGEPIVNDSIEEDAYKVGMDEFATIVSNGDGSAGTVLSRTSEEFNRIYEAADVVIAKGQANYESLSGQEGKNIYFMLMTKCSVIAENIGVPQKSLLCMNASRADMLSFIGC